jgi:hypothetical protein
MSEQENKCRQSNSGKFIGIFELASPANRSYVDV